jgi:hypothetical protein
MKLTLSQNYFTLLNKINQPEKKSLDTGSPISNTIAEIFLQYFEDKHIKHLLDTKNITYYIRYVDDVLILYESKRIHPELITTNMNQTHKDIKFNPSYEKNGQINFLDPLLIRKPTKIEIYFENLPPQIQPSISSQNTLNSTT